MRSVGLRCWAWAFLSLASWSYAWAWPLFMRQMPMFGTALPFLVCLGCVIAAGSELAQAIQRRRPRVWLRLVAAVLAVSPFIFGNRAGEWTTSLMRGQVLAQWKRERATFVVRGPQDLSAGRNISKGRDRVPFVRYDLYEWDLDNSMGIAYIPNRTSLPEKPREYEPIWNWEGLEENWYLIEGT